MRRFPFLWPAILLSPSLPRGSSGCGPLRRCCGAASELAPTRCRSAVTSRPTSNAPPASICCFAQNPALRRSVPALLRRSQAVARGGPLVHDMRRALAYLQWCFSGQPSVRPASSTTRAASSHCVVNGRRLLTPICRWTESANPFFHPTLDLPAGVVYQAAPYVSPDTTNGHLELDGDRTAAGPVRARALRGVAESFRLSGDRPRKGYHAQS